MGLEPTTTGITILNKSHLLTLINSVKTPTILKNQELMIFVLLICIE